MDYNGNVDERLKIFSPVLDVFLWLRAIYEKYGTKNDLESKKSAHADFFDS
jgi:hypothetical protein